MTLVSMIDQNGARWTSEGTVSVESLDDYLVSSLMVMYRAETAGRPDLAHFALIRLLERCRTRGDIASIATIEQSLLRLAETERERQAR
jgi:hypothetical protein